MEMWPALNTEKHVGSVLIQGRSSFNYCATTVTKKFFRKQVYHKHDIGDGTKCEKGDISNALEQRHGLSVAALVRVSDVQQTLAFSDG